MTERADLLVIGGGAAGFFGAIRYASLHPRARVIILEKGKHVLDKVRISGGGRCNVTHGCFDPRELVLNYPRGKKELLGPFHQFACGDMMGWLEERGVPTKIEEDGRVFPETDSSETIITCFRNEARRLGIEVRTSEGVVTMERQQKWKATTPAHWYEADAIFFTTGSSPQSWELLRQIGVTLVPPVPSLFTFNIKHSLLRDLPGISVDYATVELPTLHIADGGPLLITHWGLSGPAVLRISAQAARQLAERSYRCEVVVNWLSADEEEVEHALREMRNSHARKKPSTTPFQGLPKRLWERMCELSAISDCNWADVSNQQLHALCNLITHSTFQMQGKSTFKEEFVTAGGVQLDKVNFKTMESREVPGLWFAGEVLDIDAVTGGFNFQAAWTTSWIAASNIPLSSESKE